MIAIDFIVHNLEYHLVEAGYNIEVTKMNKTEAVQVFNQADYDIM